MAIKYKGFLNGNALKLLAALFMLADHIGFVFAPLLDMSATLALRGVGRLAMPLFAYMIAEGCIYTKNRRNYFLTLFSMGVVCAAAYYVALGEVYLSIMTTFSISVLLIYAYDGMVNAVKQKTGSFFTYFISFVAIIFGTVALELILHEKGGYLDYGLVGVLLPLLAYVFKNRWLRLLPFAAGLILMSLLQSVDEATISNLLTAMPEYEGLISTYLVTGYSIGGMPLQWLSLGSLVLLALYNGERGKLNLKYFFYLFYPIHLLVLQGLFMIIYPLVMM
ncbi:MAG: hypothetical protein IKA58_02010 [Clostridia bacterium]|nr:hypothetical protein [Clostridia bacterium]